MFMGTILKLNVVGLGLHFYVLMYVFLMYFSFFFTFLDYKKLTFWEKDLHWCPLNPNSG